MALNDVTIVKSNAGLGRPLPGEDYISGMVFYTNTLPSGFTSTYNKKKIFQISDAVALGIVDTYTDETPAEGEYEITDAGATGDTFKAVIVEPTIVSGVTTSVDLGTYTVGASDTNIALQGAAWAAVINAGTLTHGYSATFDTDTLTIVARSGMGISLNTGTPIVVTTTGTADGAVTQFTGGVASLLALWYYHISEFFRLAPQGVLWVGFYPVPSTYNFVEISDLQTYSLGTIRQMLIYNDVARTAANVASDCTAIQAAQATSETLHMPFSVIYSPNIKAIADLSTLTNLGLLTAPKSTVCTAQDAGARGAWLYLTEGKSITCGGAELGAVALSKVSDSISWVGKFNMSNGIELDTIAFSNGLLYTSATEGLINQLNSYRYTFLRTFVGRTGSYFNDTFTATSPTSDYGYIENNRTIDKAVRISYTTLLPQLNSPLVLNADGTLTTVTIASFTGLLQTQINQMIRNEEISAFSVTIDPTQDVLTTSILYIRLSIVPVGVARNIIVNIGFTTSI